MADNFEYNGEFLEMIKNLSPINKQIVIEKDDDKTVVKRADMSRKLAYVLTVPESHFNMTTEKIGFYNFIEFYHFLSVFKDPKIGIVTEGNFKKIVVSDENSKIRYILSEPEILGKKGNVKKISFSNPDIKFNLTVSDINGLRKMNGLTKSKFCFISIKSEQITLRLFASSKDNSYEKTFKCEKIGDYKEDFEFNIFSEVFEWLPSGDYEVQIKKEGHVMFKYTHDEFDLKLITGKVKES